MKKGLLIHPDELSPRWIERAKNVGADILALHPVGGEHADKSIEELDRLLQNGAYRDCIDEVKSTGIAFEYEMHAARYLLPVTLYKDFPELFRLDGNNNRVPDFNFCTSNPQALDIIAQNAVKLADMLYGSDESYYFWRDDVALSRCRCEKCEALSPSEQQLLYCNAIIRELRKKRPAARLCYLAYADTFAPPVSVKPEKGLFLEYAPMSRDFARPINDPECEKNAYLCGCLDGLFELFGKEGSKVLEYHLDNSMYSGWKKPPKYLELKTETAAKDINYYEKRGFEVMSTFACYLGDDYYALYGEPPVKQWSELFKG